MKVRALVAGLLLAVALGACSNDEEGRGDSPVGDRDDSPAEVVNFPDQFHNMATKCNHGNRLYTHTRGGAAPLVVPQDPSCPQETAR